MSVLLVAFYSMKTGGGWLITMFPKFNLPCVCVCTQVLQCWCDTVYIVYPDIP